MPGRSRILEFVRPFPLRKDTLEGSLQRQLVLGMCNLPVPDAMLFFEEITRHRC
jgi:hypothetical protein